MRILLVNSNIDSAENLRSEMEKHYIVDVAHSGEDGTYMSMVNDYQVTVIESGLSDMSTSAVCKKIRLRDQQIPILLLLDEENVDKRLESLSCGADIILTKPIYEREVLAYTNALIKRIYLDTNSQEIKIYDLKINFNTKEVSRANNKIKLRRKEYAVLELLVINKGKVVTSERLLEAIWEEGIGVFSNTLAVHIKCLRDKIDRFYDRKLITTVHGFGYRLEC